MPKPPPAEPQPELGLVIAELREAAAMSIAELAEAASLKTAELEAIERGDADPSWGGVRDIAATLGVSVAELARRCEALR
jgi:ribosome-binding protein aMBF1 (putative translation factor)